MSERPLCYSRVRPANWTRELALRLQLVLPAAAAAAAAPLPSTSISKVANADTCPETACPAAGPTPSSLPPPRSAFKVPPVQTKHFHWLCTVWSVFGLYFNSLLWFVFLYVKAVTFSMVTPHPHDSPPLLT